jgi:6-phosphofructokinase 1
MICGGTDMSVGASSATNAMIEEMRNMSHPARALRRIFVCEVMGANCGYLAMQAALGMGADVAIIPEQVIEVRIGKQRKLSASWKDHVDINKTEKMYLSQLEKIAEHLEAVFATKKRYGFVVVAEGIKLLTKSQKKLDAHYVAQYLTAAITGWSQPNKPDVRVQELGYSVRGVPPTQFDVHLGALLGAESVLCILRGETNYMVGWKECEGIVRTSFDEVVMKSNRPPKQILDDRPKWKETLELHQALACAPKLREQLVSSHNRFVR